MAKTSDYRLGEFTFPRGWFMIEKSATINTDKPHQVRFFGQDFALYRGKKSGKIVLLDAYCPHMKTSLAAPNNTSYVVIDGGGSNVEGDDIRCPYHGWRFGSDGKCNDIPYHEGAIPAAASVKSWTVEEKYGAIWVWHDPEGGAPDYELPQIAEWDDSNYINGDWDALGVLNQHSQEVVDNIADYGHLSPIHGSTVMKYENEFKGIHAIQRQACGHRRFESADGNEELMNTDTAYHGPGILMAKVSGMFNSRMLIMHTPIDDGSIMVWHNLLVYSPNNGEITHQMLSEAKKFQKDSLDSFMQDFEVWTQKGPCLNPLFIPSDGAFLKARIWYKQFFNPRNKTAEILEQCEGIYVPRGMIGYTEEALA